MSKFHKRICSQGTALRRVLGDVDVDDDAGFGEEGFEFEDGGVPVEVADEDTAGVEGADDGGGFDLSEGSGSVRRVS